MPKSVDYQSNTCPTCGRLPCICARWPGFKIKLWEGQKRNFSLRPDELLQVGMREALKPDAPLDFFVAALRYFVETEPIGSVGEK